MTPLVRALFAVWLVACVSGSLWLWHDKTTPSTPAVAPATWPLPSSPSSPSSPSTAARWPTLALAPPGVVTLVMFAHPLCPCTRASLGELERILASHAGHVRAHIAFFVPLAGAAGGEDLRRDFRAGALWQRARAIPGLDVIEDDDGALAATFGSATSGTVVAYAADGRLVFAGGITGARGHEGDNPARDALEARIHDEELGAAARAVAALAPVFGCGLRDPERAGEAEAEGDDDGGDDGEAL